MDLKVGVLLPQSNEYPLMAKNFMNGLKLALPDCKIIVQGIGFGNDAKQLINAIQKLVFQDDITFITGILGHSGLEEVLQYVDAINVKLIYATIQTTPIIKPKTTNSFCNSFDAYTSTYLLGKHLIKNKKINISVVSCYYEAGYGFIKALEEALYENNEATFSSYFITPLQPRKNEGALLKEFCSTTKADAIVGFYSGTYAKEFVSYVQINTFKKTPFYTLPFTIEKNLLSKYPKVLDGVTCVSSWFLELDNIENKNFVERYKNKWFEEPTLFSVLGFENGVLLNMFSKNKIIEKIKTPRGELFLNQLTKHTEAVKYLWKLMWKDEIYQVKKKESFELKSLPIKKEKKQATNNWHNTYLCY